MRSVWFVLMTATTKEVDRCLASAGFERCSDDGARWNYPTGDAVLYLRRGAYDPSEVPEQHAEVLRFTGGVCPAIDVHVDVSGHVAGDSEVRLVAELLLSR